LSPSATVRRLLAVALACGVASAAVSAADDPAAIPDSLRPWLAAQDWHRDTSGPVLSLGAPGAFDDTHVFAPCVVREGGTFLLWYCGSRGRVSERVFRLGLGSSPDGRRIERRPQSPVFEFGDGRHSILTPTILKALDGTPVREAGQLRMWFATTDFSAGDGIHTLRQSHSPDGIHWSPPSGPLLDGVYAPSVWKEGAVYRMWYADVSRTPWVIRHASSRDGRDWTPDREPALRVDQPWEARNLFYPTVVKAGDVWLMWYGSYWSGAANSTAIGFAASLDGLNWHKSPANPVLRPDPKRPWESNYTTSQSVVRLPDGSWRIWYASRRKPPFINKYFAINTASWRGFQGK
jgi:hypothetical protein